MNQVLQDETGWQLLHSRLTSQVNWLPICRWSFVSCIDYHRDLRTELLKIKSSSLLCGMRNQWLNFLSFYLGKRKAVLDPSNGSFMSMFRWIRASCQEDFKGELFPGPFFSIQSAITWHIPDSETNPHHISGYYYVLHICIYLCIYIYIYTYTCILCTWSQDISPCYLHVISMLFPWHCIWPSMLWGLAKILQKSKAPVEKLTAQEVLGMWG